MLHLVLSCVCVLLGMAESVLHISIKFNSEMAFRVMGGMQLFFLVGYVEERLWWPIQGPNIGRKKKASS